MGGTSILIEEAEEVPRPEKRTEVLLAGQRVGARALPENADVEAAGTTKKQLLPLHLLSQHRLRPPGLRCRLARAHQHCLVLLASAISAAPQVLEDT